MEQKTWTFFKDKDNVFTNVTPPKKNQAHLFERTYLRNVLIHLKKWPDFDNYSYFLLDSRRGHNFLFDEHSVVFYLSNENHKVSEELNDALAVFTSYLPKEKKNGNMHAIPLGVNGSVPVYPVIPYSQRKIDVFFSGNLHRRRIKFFIFTSWLKFVNQIRKIMGQEHLNMDVRFTRRFSAGLSPEEYGKVLADTKIALTPEGYVSNNSFRFFEAARAGCILISCKQSDDWYYTEFPGFFVNSWAELPAIIRRLRKNPEEANLIHQKILQYYNTYCAEESVANYIKKVISESN